eukprot:10368273-Alexandrium_andersonii.AAC.1
MTQRLALLRAVTARRGGRVPARVLMQVQRLSLGSGHPGSPWRRVAGSVPQNGAPGYTGRPSPQGRSRMRPGQVSGELTSRSRSARASR